MTMKTKAYTCLAAIALITTAQAGAASSEFQGSNLWQWFTGGSVGYLTDLDHGMYNFQVGMVNRNPGDRTSHSIYLQVGYAQDDAHYHYPTYIPGVPPPVGGPTENASINLHIIPITANYKFEAPITGNLNYYVGLGLGCAVMDYTNDWNWSQALPPPAINHESGTDSETYIRLYGELFGGLSYNISDSFQVFGGARFICMSNVDHYNHISSSPANYNAGLNHDFLLELGARYRF